MDKMQIEMAGHPALVADHCQLVARVDALTELMTALAATVATLDARISELEYLMSEELMRNLLPEPCAPPNVSAATSELYPVASTTAGVTADSWLPADADWVTDFATIADGK